MKHRWIAADIVAAAPSGATLADASTWSRYATTRSAHGVHTGFAAGNWRPGASSRMASACGPHDCELDRTGTVIVPARY